MSRFVRSLAFVVAVLALAACGASPTPPPVPTADANATAAAVALAAQAQQTEVARQVSQTLTAAAPTATSTATVTPIPTATYTPPPATETATATPTRPPAPTATAAASPKHWTGEQVGAALKAAGLEFEAARPMIAGDYGFAPFVCKGTRFLVPSLGPDNGGRLFECGSIDERDRLVRYYQELSKGSAIFFSWLFARDNILIQINGSLAEPQARKYEAALNGMK